MFSLTFLRSWKVTFRLFSPFLDQCVNPVKPQSRDFFHSFDVKLFQKSEFVLYLSCEKNVPFKKKNLCIQVRKKLITEIH